MSKKQVLEVEQTLEKYAIRTKQENEEVTHPKDTKRSHLHPSFRAAGNVKALRRDMYQCRLSQQWSLESPWWNTQNGKDWLASQNLENAHEFWRLFGVAHKLWTFEETYKHNKKTNEKLRNDSKNIRVFNY